MKKIFGLLLVLAFSIGLLSGCMKEQAKASSFDKQVEILGGVAQLGANKADYKLLADTESRSVFSTDTLFMFSNEDNDLTIMAQIIIDGSAITGDTDLETINDFSDLCDAAGINEKKVSSYKFSRTKTKLSASFQTDIDGDEKNAILIVFFFDNCQVVCMAQTDTKQQKNTMIFNPCGIPPCRLNCSWITSPMMRKRKP